MNRLITSVLVGLVGLNAVVCAEAARPKLVVGIMVDQLRTDYLEYLRDLFGEKGFNRLMKGGVYMRDVDFRTSGLDAVSATAVAYTGSYPAMTGVPSARIYDPKQKKTVAPLEDPQAMGNFTSENYSPAPLRLSTIADEIVIDGAGVNAVYAIATDPQQAVILAGHAGNSAAWLNENSGKWATSTYYHETPPPLNARNYSRPLTSRIDTMQWKPMLPLERYPGIPAQKRIYTFRYTFPTSDRDVYRMFASSPMANTEVTDLAIDYLQGMKLGNRGDAIDMLNLAYTAAPYKYVRDGDFRLELEDTYIRLDAQLGRLFDAIDRSVGLDNALIFLTSTGYYDDATIDDPKYRIPSGEVSVKRATSLLNSYLSAKYGNADYVDSYYDGHLYLDHSVIDQKKLNLGEVVADARGFLAKMSGVSAVYTLDEILAGGSDDTEALRLKTDPKLSGDLYLSFTPGWNVSDDLRYPVSKYPVRSSMTLTPAFIMEKQLAPRTINATVEAAVLAPTVSSTLKIRSPNGASRRPLGL